MFALIESNPARPQGGEWTPRLASFAAHTALIAAAVLATHRVVTAPPPVFVDRHIIYDVPPPAPPPGLPSSPFTSAPVPAWTVVPAPPLTIPSEIPPPGTSEPMPVLTGDPIPGSVLSNLPGGLPAPGHAPLDARLVEEQPVMLAHPQPNYPEVLRQAGIEGRVLVEAVLDTLGRAEPSSLRITESPNPLFDREAMSVVAGSRYRPGRMDGHAVRVRIQVPVSFSIRR